MTSKSQRLATRSSELARAFLHVLDEPRPAGVSPARELTSLREPVERFCRDARQAGIQPATIRRFVGALLDMSLPPGADPVLRREAVRDVERLVDHASCVTAFH
jgi:hypothetical protein